MSEWPRYGPNKPRIKLVGQDGNIFGILGQCKRAAMANDWSEEQYRNFMDAIRVCPDYTTALKVVMSNFNDEAEDMADLDPNSLP